MGCIFFHPFDSLRSEREHGEPFAFHILSQYLQLLTLQLTIGYKLRLPPTSFVRHNIYIKKKRVPDPTFWAVGLCFWMVRMESCAPNPRGHPSNGCSSPRNVFGSNLRCQAVLVFKILTAPRRQWTETRSALHSLVHSPYGVFLTFIRYANPTNKTPQHPPLYHVQFVQKPLGQRQ